MPVITIKNGQQTVHHKCPFCHKFFEDIAAGSQLVQVIHLQMCNRNDEEKVEKHKNQVKRLNDRKSSKITKYFKRK